MKRSLLYFMILVFILTVLPNSYCISEDIQKVTVGKVDFSMTKSEIKKATGASESKPLWDLLTPEELQPKNVLYLGRTSFAGYDNCTIIYSFDDERLIAINVLMDIEQEEKADADREFENLNDALSKYGDILASGNEYIAFNSDAYNAIEVLKSNSFAGKKEGFMWYQYYTTNILDSSQRLVNQGDSYVDILLLKFKRTEKYEKIITPWDSEITNTDYYSVILSYTLCSQELINNILNDAKNRNTALHDDV